MVKENAFFTTFYLQAHTLLYGRKMNMKIDRILLKCSVYCQNYIFKTISENRCLAIHTTCIILILLMAGGPHI